MGGYWLIENINIKIPSTKRRLLRKKREGKKKEKLRKANVYWNNWNLQLYWDNIEWINPKNKYLKKNTFFTSTHKF